MLKLYDPFRDKEMFNDLFFNISDLGFENQKLFWQVSVDILPYVSRYPKDFKSGPQN